MMHAKGKRSFKQRARPRRPLFERHALAPGVESLAPGSHLTYISSVKSPPSLAEILMVTPPPFLVNAWLFTRRHEGLGWPVGLVH
jgi:hypothetical protein